MLWGHIERLEGTTQKFLKKDDTKLKVTNKEKTKLGDSRQPWETPVD